MFFRVFILLIEIRTINRLVEFMGAILLLLVIQAGLMLASCSFHPCQWLESPPQLAFSDYFRPTYSGPCFYYLESIPTPNNKLDYIHIILKNSPFANSLTVACPLKTTEESQCSLTSDDSKLSEVNVRISGKEKMALELKMIRQGLVAGKNAEIFTVEILKIGELWRHLNKEEGTNNENFAHHTILSGWVDFLCPVAGVILAVLLVKQQSTKFSFYFLEIEAWLMAFRICVGSILKQKDANIMEDPFTPMLSLIILSFLFLWIAKECITYICAFLSSRSSSSRIESERPNLPVLMEGQEIAVNQRTINERSGYIWRMFAEMREDQKRCRLILLVGLLILHGLLLFFVTQHEFFIFLLKIAISFYAISHFNFPQRNHIQAAQLNANEFNLAQKILSEPRASKKAVQQTITQILATRKQFCSLMTISPVFIMQLSLTLLERDLRKLLIQSFLLGFAYCTLIVRFKKIQSHNQAISITVARSNEGGICNICLEGLDANKAGDREVKTECGHFYHLGCLSTWSQTNPICPVDRRKLDLCSLLEARLRAGEEEGHGEIDKDAFLN